VFALIAMWGSLHVPLLYDIAVVVSHYYVTFSVPLDMDKLRDDDYLFDRYKIIQ